MYSIYNHSSTQMHEVGENSVDLIVVAPPYNIGTLYGKNRDMLNFPEYVTLVHSVLGECHRVLKKEGALIIESADSVLMDGKYVALAGLLQKISIGVGFSLLGRNINFVHTTGGVELPEDTRWNSGYVAEERNAHSNCHQIMSFSKKERSFIGWGEVQYMNYESDPIHPCPFPWKMVEFLLNRHFHGGVVLEPFMGTARLGEGVIWRGGHYIGYEIDHTIFKVAEKNLAIRQKQNS